MLVNRLVDQNVGTVFVVHAEAQFLSHGVSGQFVPSCVPHVDVTHRSPVLNSTRAGAGPSPSC
ncbi:hypothetical protein ACFQ1S_13565, partial [Kibdelosporangium lantanae]